MPFIIIFVCIPLIEVAAFAYIGGEIGIVKTLLFCVLTALIGGLVIKAQEINTIISAQSHMMAGQVPLSEIFDGICLGIAGALLLTPGFFTDSIGFALLIPPVRNILRGHVQNYFAQKPFFKNYNFTPDSHNNSGDIIDGEYETVVKKANNIDHNKQD